MRQKAPVCKIFRAHESVGSTHPGSHELSPAKPTAPWAAMRARSSITSSATYVPSAADDPVAGFGHYAGVVVADPGGGGGGRALQRVSRRRRRLHPHARAGVAAGRRRGPTFTLRLRPGPPLAPAAGDADATRRRLHRASAAWPGGAGTADGIAAGCIRLGGGRFVAGWGPTAHVHAGQCHPRDCQPRRVARAHHGDRNRVALLERTRQSPVQHSPPSRENPEPWTRNPFDRPKTGRA